MTQRVDASLNFKSSSSSSVRRHVTVCIRWVRHIQAKSTCKTPSYLLAGMRPLVLPNTGKTYQQNTILPTCMGWSGGAMVLGKLPVPGRPTTRITVGQGPTALAVGAGEGCLDILTLAYPFSPLFPSLREMARYRLKYCLKGPLNPKQPTNQLAKQPMQSRISTKMEKQTYRI